MTTKLLSPRALPNVAVAHGATSPAGGTVGAMLWSTTTNALMIWDGTNWWAYARLDSNGFVQSSNLSSAEIDDGNSGSADTIDWSAGRFHKSTLTANCTYTFTSPGASRVAILQLQIVQDTTPRTITWPASVKWAGGAAPTLSTGSGAIDIVTFRWNGTNYFGTHSKGFA